MRAACEGSRAVVTLTAAAADGARRWLGVETRVIAPGVDLGAFAPGGERAEAPTIVCAAALSEPRKRAGLLLDAFARVRRERPGARLVLSRPADPREASAFAERDGVELADLDDTAALAGAYRSAWVSALPATGEAFGLVLAEALACGTPAVGTGDGGIPEVLDGPLTGRVVAPGGDDEPERFARALLEGFELAADPSAAAACRERAQAFSAERCTDAYVALYEELLDA
jgi:glycosyltransferase involved in cell wall biosynthesis